MIEAFLINPQHQPKSKGKARSQSRSRKNPLGEEILVIGGNPVTKRKEDGKKTTIIATNPKRKGRQKKTAMKTDSQKKRYSRNPASYSLTSRDGRGKRQDGQGKRQYRRNPEEGRAFPNVKKPQTLIIPLLVGVGANVATNKVPAMLNLTGNTKLLAQAGVAVGGGILLKKFLGPIGALVWITVAGSQVIINMLQNNLGLNLSDIPDEIQYSYPAVLPDDGGMVLSDDGEMAYPELNSFPQELNALGSFPGEGY